MYYAPAQACEAGLRRVLLVLLDDILRNHCSDNIWSCYCLSSGQFYNLLSERNILDDVRAGNEGDEMLQLCMVYSQSVINVNRNWSTPPM